MCGSAFLSKRQANSVEMQTQPDILKLRLVTRGNFRNKQYIIFYIISESVEKNRIVPTLDKGELNPIKLYFIVPMQGL